MEDFTPAQAPRFLTESGECPVAKTFQTLGGKHKPNILHVLSAGELHFLERALTGISRKVLTEQLRDLERHGLVNRVEKNDSHLRVGYSLTEKAQALGAIVSQLRDWDESYSGPPAGVSETP
jgi:DNA-binding HxlR family transcriptional regulator